MRPFEVRSIEMRPFEVRSVELRPFEACPFEACLARVGSSRFASQNSHQLAPRGPPPGGSPLRDPHFESWPRRGPPPRFTLRDSSCGDLRADSLYGGPLKVRFIEIHQLKFAPQTLISRRFAPTR